MEGAGDLMLLPGERFCPMEDELLLFYLKPKVNGMKVPGNQEVISELDLYGDQDPWKIWSSFEARRANDLRRNKVLYFFTQKKKKTERSSRASRTVGSGGTWKGQNAAKKIYLLDQDQKPTSTLLGFKKTYTSKNPMSPQHNGGWIMYEFELDDSQLLRKKQVNKNDYVLCLLRKNDLLAEKKRKRQEEEQEMIEDYVEEDDGDHMDHPESDFEEPKEKRQRLLPCTDEQEEFLQPAAQPLDAAQEQFWQPEQSSEGEQEQFLLSDQEFLQQAPSSMEGGQENFWLSDQQFLQPAPPLREGEQEQFLLMDQQVMQPEPSMESEQAAVPIALEAEPLVLQEDIEKMGLQEFVADYVETPSELAELEKWLDNEFGDVQQLEAEPQLGEEIQEQQLYALSFAADDLVQQTGAADVHGGNLSDALVFEDCLMSDEQPTTMEVGDWSAAYAELEYLVLC